jgi:hypothetical protein
MSFAPYWDKQTDDVSGEESSPVTQDESVTSPGDATTESSSSEVSFVAADGFLLRGRLWRTLADDEFGTIPAIQRLLRYFRNSPRTHLHIEPQDIGQASVGHFSFFHSRFESSLWRLPLEWLRHGCLPADVPGRILPSHQHDLQ